MPGLGILKSVAKLPYAESVLLFSFSSAFIDSQNGLGWKGPYRPSGSNPCAMGRDTFH